MVIFVTVTTSAVTSTQNQVEYTPEPQPRYRPEAYEANVQAHSLQGRLAQDAQLTLIEEKPAFRGRMSGLKWESLDDGERVQRVDT